MKQSVDAFMSKMLEDNTYTPNNAASNAEKIGKQMEQALKEMTQRFEDKDAAAAEAAKEPVKSQAEPVGADPVEDLSNELNIETNEDTEV